MEHIAIRCLRQEMRNISEDVWCAEWMTDIEYYLWYALQHPGETIYEAHRADLQWLADQAHGWIWWDDTAKDVVFVSLDVWEAFYAAWEAKTQQDPTLLENVV